MKQHIFAFLHRLFQACANYFFEKLDREEPVYYVTDSDYEESHRRSVEMHKRAKLFWENQERTIN